MNENCRTIGRPNPFSTRRVRPGAIVYIFPAGDNAGRMAERLKDAGWRGEIVGPHGSGKSALLATLIPAMRLLEMEPILIELHDGQRRLPIAPQRLSLQRGCSVLIVDGYEQLGRWARFRLGRFCRRQGIGLLITSHRPMGLPELHRTSPTEELARQIVDKLLADERCEDAFFAGLGGEEIKNAFARHGGDIREMLFELYDLYEQRRHGRGRKEQ